jgi:hypothetical protein
MNAPGTRLRALATRFCDSRTLERLIDPVIADQQHEYANAVVRGDAWGRRRARLSGCIAFWKVALVAAGRASGQDVITADNGAVGRTIRFAGIATTLTTALLIWPPLSQAPALVSGARNTVLLVIYLLPQALAITLTMGLIFGVLCGLRGREVSPRSRLAILALAFATSLAALAVAGWILPEANQAFREFMFAAVSGQRRVRLARGMNELSLVELWSTDAYQFHARLALAFAPLVLGMFSIELTTMMRRARTATTGAVALAVCFAYYVLLFTGRELAVGRSDLAPGYHVPGSIAAWAPNLLFAAAALLLRLRTRGRSAAGPSRLDGDPRSADQPVVPPA